MTPRPPISLLAACSLAIIGTSVDLGLVLSGKSLNRAAQLVVLVALWVICVRCWVMFYYWFRESRGDRS